MPKSAIRPLGWQAALLLLLGYIALDWTSQSHPLHGLAITPWSPAPALGLLCLVRYGGRAAQLLALAILAADGWLRDLSLPWQLGAGLAIQLAAGDWAIAEVMRRRLNRKGVFADRRGLITWVSIVVIGTLFNSLAFIAGLLLTRFLPPEATAESLLHHWLGQLGSVLVFMPLLAMIMGARGRARLRPLLLGQESLSLVATGSVLAFTFFTGEMTEFKYFSVLFLPIA